MEWSKEWPTKEGTYWFYGYRYGRISCGFKCDPEYCFVRVFKAANGLMFKADGQFLYKSETEEAHFKKYKFPTPPILKKYKEVL